MSQPNCPTRWSGVNVLLFWLNVALVVTLLVRFWTGSDRSLGPIPGDKNAELRPVAARGELHSDEQININIFEQNSPCTVNVTTFTNQRDLTTFDILKVPQGSGTGFIWDTWDRNGQQCGRIVTNYHVIANARRSNGSVDPAAIQVTLADHSTWKVDDVNFAENKDLAVLWTNAPADRLQLIKIGESSNLKVGQKVYAIGNPFGLDQSLTTGIISALGRDLRADESRTTLRGLIQTDASINPGNSGGPLLDSAGRLIGVNTAIVSPSGASAGIGFAIPVDDVNRVVTGLIRKEVQLKPSMGVHIAVNNRITRGNGVLILDVEPDSPAAKAGLQPTIRDRSGIIQIGDIIRAIDDTTIRYVQDLNDALDKCKVGQEVTVTVLRDEQEVSIKLTLAAMKR